jgi:hypothetical protein
VNTRFCVHNGGCCSLSAKATSASGGEAVSLPPDYLTGVYRRYALQTRPRDSICSRVSTLVPASAVEDGKRADGSGVNGGQLDELAPFLALAWVVVLCSTTGTLNSRHHLPIPPLTHGVLVPSFSPLNSYCSSFSTLTLPTSTSALYLPSPPFSMSQYKSQEELYWAQFLHTTPSHPTMA